MALYAFDEDDLIFAAHAEKGKIYWCLDCYGPVKKRYGRYENGRFPHFYHVKPAPLCRLHSKTEDHLRAQLQLQKIFPEGSLQLERTFIDINRIADVCWEKEKIIFEIQCAPITEKEVEMRTRDYRTKGYEVVWLLDEKRYNKRVLRPAEAYLRSLCTYYVSIKPGLFSEYYDQFEVFSEGKRVKKGHPFLLNLQQVRNAPKISFNKELFPQQILKLNGARYFYGDRLSRALHAPKNPYFAAAMQKWRMAEIQLSKITPKTSKLKKFLYRYIGVPYLFLLRQVLKQAR